MFDSDELSALQQEIELGLQRVGAGVLVEAREERVVLGLLQQQLGREAVGEPARKRGLADADGAFDDDVAERIHGAGSDLIGAHLAHYLLIGDAAHGCVVESRQQRRRGAVPGNRDIRRDVDERLQDETVFQDIAARQVQGRFIEHEIIVKQEVDIQRCPQMPRCSEKLP